MKNTKDAVLYGLAGGAVGYGIAYAAKTKKTWTMVLIAAGAIVGGIVGNNS